MDATARCSPAPLGGSATVGQICGVTLEPFENEVDEAIDVVFRPDAAELSAEKTSTGAEIPLEDETEPLVNGMIDLGALATESQPWHLPLSTSRYGV
jgi:hypothetical protein